MHKRALNLLCACFIFHTTNYAQNNIKSAIDSLIKDTCFQHASIGFEVRDLSNDSTIYAFNSQKSLTPASSMKTITTSAALEILGPDFQFKTKIGYRGKIDQNGVLHGNVYIVGGGDPCIGSRFFPDYYGNYLQKWAKSIQTAGIRKIEGKIIADMSMYGEQSVPNEWIWGDIGNYYGSGTFALCTCDNAFTAYYNTSNTVGGKTKIDSVRPYIPYMKLENHVTTAHIKSDKSFFYGGPHQHERISRGQLPRRRWGYRVKGAIPDPGLLLAYQLDSTLKTKQIGTALPPGETFTAPQDTNFTTLLTMHSPKLSTIINVTNHFSVNLFAEQIFRYLGWSTFHDATYSNCIKAVKDFWASKGINTSALFMYDGCGLSPHDAVSPNFFCTLLTYMHNKSDVSKAFIHSLPLNCHTGTLDNFCSNNIACGRITAKSGSINNVKTYVGYVRTLKGKRLVFAVMINQFNCDIHEVKDKLVPLMDAMVRYKE